MSWLLSGFQTKLRVVKLRKSFTNSYSRAAAEVIADMSAFRFILQSKSHETNPGKSPSSGRVIFIRALECYLSGPLVTAFVPQPSLFFSVFSDVVALRVAHLNLFALFPPCRVASFAFSSFCFFLFFYLS
jgi:hypothetical protein